MAVIPDVITHNYDPARGCLRNLCDLPPKDAERVLDDIRASGKRSIKPSYLQRRLRTEAWLIEQRTGKLGYTPLARPVYFFLGDFSDGLDPSRPNSLVMPLAALPENVLTFTYPDSMASLPLATKEEHRPERRPYHGQVFTLPEIIDVVERFGFSQADHTMNQFDRFIEVQLWDLHPVQEWLGERRQAQSS